MWKLSLRYACPLALLALSPFSTWALCCPSVGQKPARSGIGETQPLAANLSQDRRWQVHAFERDAINYYQVSDSAGSTQFILGKSGDTFWVLPAGPVETQISLPSDGQHSIAAEGAVEVYRDDQFGILFHAGPPSRWSVDLGQ